MEQARANYIASKTVTGEDIVDPAGREFHIQPSGVTRIRTHGFGLGKIHAQRPDILEKVGEREKEGGPVILTGEEPTFSFFFVSLSPSLLLPSFLLSFLSSFLPFFSLPDPYNRWKPT